jgi:hypothetical protein
MYKLLLLFILFLPMKEPFTIDFGKDKTNAWFSVNDTVMGGRSAGTTSYDKDALLFAGDVSY